METGCIVVREGKRARPSYAVSRLNGIRGSSIIRNTEDAVPNSHKDVSEGIEVDVDYFELEVESW